MSGRGPGDEAGPTAPPPRQRAIRRPRSSGAALVKGILHRLVDTSRRHARAVVVAGLMIIFGAGWYSLHHIKVNADTDQMFSASLPWRQRQIAMDRAFPQFDGLLIAVVDARLPEEAEETARQLAQALGNDHAHFSMVSRPGAGPYFREEGLLFLSVSELTDLLNRTIDAQPFLGTLSADPTARGLFDALGLLGQGVAHGAADLAPYRTELEAFHGSMAAAIADHPQPLSWQQMLSGGLSNLGGDYQFVVLKPRLDFRNLQPGGAAAAAIQTAAGRLSFVLNGAARVRVTGPVALADDQFKTVTEGAVSGMVISTALIVLWLVLAERSWRLILPVLGTLTLGLALTVLFAVTAVGTLNLISIGFGILFVGIAVDFGLQFSVRFRMMKHVAGGNTEALWFAARRAGGAILTAALATAAGFLSFVPTSFRGVAELGMIAGLGMLIAFFCTVTFLPAAITACGPREESADVGFALGHRADRVVGRWHRQILGLFTLLFVLALALSPRLTFDADPLDTQNQNTEAMRTLRDLMNQPLSNPYSTDILAPDIGAAEGLATRLRALPTVSKVLTVNSFVPSDQDQKLALIQDAASILTPSLLPPPSDRPATPADVRAAAASALAKVEPALPLLPSGDPLHAIAGDLQVLEHAPDATIHAVNEALTGFLPLELDRLRTALGAQRADVASLPADLKRDWLLPDGQARIQALPVASARNSQGLHRFVAEVTRVAPDAGGTAVAVVASSETIIAAFRSAAIGAVVAIAVILLATLGHLRDAALVLAPLLLSAALTLLAMVLLPLPLNYANIIALPLLLGVGVSFNIYFVVNWRNGVEAVLGSATARAVLFSALTTGTAFGSLALSQHPGTASMGELLLLSLGCTLVATLVFVPALLAAAGPIRDPRPRPPREH
jgi:hopanoid biosynthesis associated RND transporter like protein HpnN